MTVIARVSWAGWIGVVGLFGSGCGGAVTDTAAAESGDSGLASARGGPDSGGGRGAHGSFDGSSGPVACGGGACPSPGNVSAFVPTWRPPSGAHQGQCTPALIDEYYQNCLSVGGTQACDAFGGGADQAHQTCAGCISSNFGDPTWGPLVRSGGVVETNGSGCIALVDPSAIDCAKAVQANDECEHAACDPVCRAGSAAAFDQWDQCGAAANTCGCGSWFAASNCVQDIAADGGLAAQCLVGQTFQDFFSVTAAVFCGN
ncbi:MAG: hypothetical protein WBY94_29405 [Polyangiaceae bacterium]